MIQSFAMKFILPAVAFVLSLISSSVIAGGVYQEPDAFIKESFDNNPPDPQVVWISKTLKTQIEAILQHKYQGLRIRYWMKNKKTAWILNEIGKEKPITTGIVINNNAIERIRILIFRESRGWEVRHTFFTQQFDNVSLTNTNELSTPIDNISGATLSVRAITKQARLALLLHKQVTNNVTP